MSIVLVGSTSGSCTLQEQAVAGTTVLTLPTTSGTVLTTASSGQSIPKAALPTGSVLQVIQSVKTDTFSTTSAYPTFVDITGLSVTITPTSSTSKILVFVNLVMGTSSYNAYYRLYRGSTAILIADAAGNRATTTQAMDAGDTDSTRKQTPNNTTYLDSPATTSATTYKATICARRGADTVYVNRSGNDNNDSEFDPRSTSTITVMEIAA